MKVAKNETERLMENNYVDKNDKLSIASAVFNDLNDRNRKLVKALADSDSLLNESNDKLNESNNKINELCDEILDLRTQLSNAKANIPWYRKLLLKVPKLSIKLEKRV